MALEIPSLPSADINNMLSLIIGQGRKTFKPWLTVATEHPTEIVSDEEQTPEPRTPKFGQGSAPTFDESNNMFGFKFPRKRVDEKGKVIRSPNTTDIRNSVPTPTPAARTVTAPEYIVIEDDAEVAPNIPVTVVEAARIFSPRKPNMDPNDLPQIMLASENGKPPSYIRFLNDPIPVPVMGDYMPQEINLDSYRKIVPTGDVVMMDIDAIQQMEAEEPPGVHPEQTTEGSQKYAVKSCYNQDQTAGVRNGYHDVNDRGIPYQVSEDSSCSSSQTESDGSVYIPTDSADHVPEVAAYQSVEETPSCRAPPTYITLTTRPTPEPHTPLSETQAPNNLPVGVQQNYEAAHTVTTPNNLPVGVQQNYKAAYTVQATNNLPLGVQQEYETAQPVKDTCLLNSLKNKIQQKRLKEGKGELKVTFEDRPLGEPSEEEKKKAERRRQKNRESAVKSRVKKQTLMEELLKEVKMLERENKKLKTEIRDIEIDMSTTADAPLHCGCDLVSDHSGNFGIQRVPVRGVSVEQIPEVSLRQAIQNLLDKEVKST